MSSSKLRTIVIPNVGTNCYLLYSEDTKEAIIFDPADEAPAIIEAIEELSLIPKGLFLTHGHYDHIYAILPLKQKYRIDLYGHQEEDDILQRPEYNLSMFHGRNYTACLDQKLIDGQTVDIAGFQVRVLHTPGHTKGGACYYLEKEKLLFSGDTIFYESVGRCDLPTGSGSMLMHAFREKVMTLPEDVTILPGHGDRTTVGHEKVYNPYC